MKLLLKSSFYISITALCVLTLSVKTMADPLFTISGLSSGTEVNGYYTSPPYVTVQLSPSYPEPCEAQGGTVPGNGTIQVTLSNNLGAMNGTYDWQILEDTNNDALVLKDITNNYQTGIDSCNWNTPDPNYEVQWSQSIQYDESNPSISITSPSNNTDYASTDSSITVSGTVSDTGSGIKSVTVNGVRASVSADTFTATVGINYGLNTLTATATSNVNSTATSQSVSVFRYENASSGSGTANTPSNGSGSTPLGITNKPSANTTNNPSSDNNSTGSDASPKNKANASTVSTPVKVAGGVGAAGAVGVVTASWLGYIPYKRIGLFVGKFVLK